MWTLLWFIFGSSGPTSSSGSYAPGDSPGEVVGG
jgi:hypothetical protein